MSVFLVHIVAFSIDPVPAFRHPPGRSQVIPRFSFFYPTSLHFPLASVICLLEIIPASIFFIEKPPCLHPAVSRKMEPGSLFLSFFRIWVVDPGPLIGIRSSAGNKFPASILLLSPLTGDTALWLFPCVLVRRRKNVLLSCRTRSYPQA